MAASASARTAPSALAAQAQSHLASSSPITTMTTTTPTASDKNSGTEGRVIVVQSSSPITASTPVPVDKIAIFGPGGRRYLHRALDLTVVKLICVARLPPSLVDIDKWKELFTL